MIALTSLFRNCVVVILLGLVVSCGRNAPIEEKPILQNTSDTNWSCVGEHGTESWHCEPGLVTAAELRSHIPEAVVSPSDGDKITETDDSMPEAQTIPAKPFPPIAIADPADLNLPKVTSGQGDSGATDTKTDFQVEQKGYSAEQQILGMGRDQFMIQWLAVSERSALDSLNDSMGTDMMVVKLSSKGRAWYALLQGPYATYSEAEAVEAFVPNEPGTPNLEPWVRSIDSLQQAIQAAPSPL